MSACLVQLSAAAWLYPAHTRSDPIVAKTARPHALSLPGSLH